MVHQSATTAPAGSDLELRMQPVFEAAWAAQDVQGDDDRAADLRERGARLAGDAQELLLGRGLDPAAEEARMAELERRAAELARDTGGEAGPAPTPEPSGGDTGGGAGPGEGGTPADPGQEPAEPSASAGARPDDRPDDKPDDKRGDRPDDPPAEPGAGGLAAQVAGILADPTWTRAADEAADEGEEAADRATLSLGAHGRGQGLTRAAVPAAVPAPPSPVRAPPGEVGVDLCTGDPDLPGCPGAPEPDAIPRQEPTPPAADLPGWEPPEQGPDILGPELPGSWLDDLPGLGVDDPPPEPDLKLPDPTAGIEFLSGAGWSPGGGLTSPPSGWRCGGAC
jgi:hypothetical protein